ncbi:MAG TPA: NBR1-Ig-like domain-containing protein [Myxococcales bacterium]|jgi:MYXO-CTERM domain-containing protein
MSGLRVFGLFAALSIAAPAVCGAACPEPAITGVQPCDTVLKAAMTGAGAGTLGSAGWPIKTMHAYLGANAKVVPGWVPCVILSAVATTESNWHQFGYVSCGNSAETLVSFDCGYGIGQITSGMDGTGGFSPSRVAADATYNMSVSANIMISKWEYTSAVDPNDPKIAEDWYFALWGYNGLAVKNNPNTHPETLGSYYNPDSPAYPRSSYAYQEVVLGYALYPRNGSDGAPRWPSTKLTHINFTEICSACGNPGSSLVVSRVSPEHSGDCVPTGPDYAAQYVAQSFPLASKGAVTLRPGETAAATLEMKNVGLKAWDSNTRLATTGPRDRSSPFFGPDWLAADRLAQVTGTVEPGSNFTFAFTFQGPDVPGDYSEHYGFVQEGVTWFGDPGQGGPPDEQIEAHLIVLPPEPADAGSPAGPDASAPPKADASTSIIKSDAGSTLRPDAGGQVEPLPDGGTVAKADGSANDPGAVGSGCGCAVSTTAFGWPLALLALGALRRPRRRNFS